jgi:PHD/YefM family antitoxin component YafN of YafNO toxin-antitoxin module
MQPNVQDEATLANFTSNPKPYLEKLRQSGEPLVLTVDGHADVVLQDAASYQLIRKQIERMEVIAAVKESLKDVAAGRTRPVREALAELSRKHNLPPAQGD